MSDKPQKPNWAEKAHLASSLAQNIQLEGIKRRQEEANRIQGEIAHAQLLRAGLEANRLSEEQRHLEFRRDTQWLEASDAAGRCEYFLEKGRIEMLRALSNSVFQATCLLETPTAPSMVDCLVNALLADTNYEKAKARFNKADENLKSLSQASKGSTGSFAACVFATLLVWPLGIYLIYREQKRRKQARAQLPAAEHEHASALKEHDLARTRLDSWLMKAKAEFAAWATSVNSKLLSTRDLMLKDGRLGVEFKKCIEAKAKEFPNTLRVDWSKIGPGEFEGQLQSVADSIPGGLDFATPQLILTQLTCAGQAELASQLQARMMVLMEICGLGEEARLDEEYDQLMRESDEVIEAAERALGIKVGTASSGRGSDSAVDPTPSNLTGPAPARPTRPHRTEPTSQTAAEPRTGPISAPVTFPPPVTHKPSAGEASGLRWLLLVGGMVVVVGLATVLLPPVFSGKGVPPTGTEHNLQAASPSQSIEERDEVDNGMVVKSGETPSANPLEGPTAAITAQPEMAPPVVQPEITKLEAGVQEAVPRHTTSIAEVAKVVDQAAMGKSAEAIPLAHPGQTAASAPESSQSDVDHSWNLDTDILANNPESNEHPGTLAKFVQAKHIGRQVKVLGTVASVSSAANSVRLDSTFFGGEQSATVSYAVQGTIVSDPSKLVAGLVSDKTSWERKSTFEKDRYWLIGTIKDVVARTNQFTDFIGRRQDREENTIELGDCRLYRETDVR